MHVAQVVPDENPDEPYADRGTNREQPNVTQFDLVQSEIQRETANCDDYGNTDKSESDKGEAPKPSALDSVILSLLLPVCYRAF